MKITEKVGTSLFLLFMLLVAFLMVFVGQRNVRNESMEADFVVSPSPTATVSATPSPTPKSVIITHPKPMQPSSQPVQTSAPQAPQQPVIINNTQQQQPAQEPAPQPTPEPQPTQNPGVIDNVLDSLRNIL